MESRIKKIKFGMTISDKAAQKDYIVVEEHRFYVKAQRLFKGEPHFSEEYRCFSLGDLVVMGLEDGEDVPEVLVEDW